MKILTNENFEYGYPHSNALLTFFLNPLLHTSAFEMEDFLKIL